MAHARRPVVLVVDDDPGIRDALSMVLESDYAVVTAADGRAALEVFRQRSVDAVLLDLRLPDIGGLDVLRQMRAIDPRVDVILVTAVHEIPITVQGIRSGAVDYITKPFETECLLAALAQATRRRCGVEHILLVAAGICVLTALEVILERTVATAVCVSPRAALNGLAGQRPRLVVLDHQAGPAGAADLVSRLRIRYAGCPFVRLVEPHDVGEIFERIGAAMTALTDVNGAKPRVRRVVFAAAEHVSRRYQDKLLGRDIAETVGVSRDHLGQAFDESLGITVKEFVTRFRVSAACHLLADADFKLEHVAELTGFDDASHLSRVFVQQRGMRPGAYRRRLEIA